MRRVLGVTAAVGLVAFSACGRVESGQRLVIAYPTGLHSTALYDPAHEEYAVAILGNVYEGLVEVNPDLSVRPVLAESWYNPDDLTWVFELRRGVRFHDGRTLTAEDAVASLDRARQEPWMAGELADVARVRANGEHQLVIETRVPFSTLPARLTFALVSGPPPADGGPAPGTGPYRFRSWGGPEGSTVLAAFPGYREGPPPIPEVEFLAVREPLDRARRLRQGLVHVISDVLPSQLGSGTAGVEVATTPGLRVLFLVPDCASENSPQVRPAGNPFRDRRVREAMALAVNRQALIDGPLEGQGEGVDQIPAASEIGYEPGLPARGLDPTRAGQLVDAVAPGGFDVDLDYMAGKYLAADAMVAMLASQLSRAGVRAQPRPHDAAGLFRMIEERKSSLYVLGWMNESGSAHETYASLLHSPAGGSGVMNGGGYASADLDRVLDAYPSQRDHRARVDLLRRATRIVDAELPLIPLYRQKSVYAFASKLRFTLGLYPRVRVARLRWKG